MTVLTRSRVSMVTALLSALVLVGCHPEFGTEPHGGVADGPPGRPTLVMIEAFHTDGLDQLRFTFAGQATPNFLVQYIPADPFAGVAPTVPGETATEGSFFLLVTFDPAGLMDPSQGPLTQVTPRLPVLRDVRLATLQKPGRVAYVVGLSARNAFRATAQPPPARSDGLPTRTVVVDVMAELATDPAQ